MQYTLLTFLLMFFFLIYLFLGPYIGYQFSRLLHPFPSGLFLLNFYLLFLFYLNFRQLKYRPACPSGEKAGMPDCNLGQPAQNNFSQT